MPDNTTLNNAVIIIIVTNILTALGAWITARINTTGEKPTDIFIKSLQEARARYAEILKENIDLKAEIKRMNLKVAEAESERDAYIVLSSEQRRMLRRWAPKDVILPEVDLNGASQDVKK